MKPLQILAIIWSTASTAFAASSISLSSELTRPLLRIPSLRSRGLPDQPVSRSSPETRTRQPENHATDTAAKGRRVLEPGQAAQKGKPSSRDVAVDRATPDRSTTLKGSGREEQNTKSSHPSSPNTHGNVRHSAIAANDLPSELANPKGRQKDTSGARHQAAFAGRNSNRMHRLPSKATSTQMESPADGYWERYENLMKFRSRL